MIRTEVIIGVDDVQKSSAWYQALLHCKSMHGGETFEILADHNNKVILNLHKWGEHEHPTLTGSAAQRGTGLILYFKVENLNEIRGNAKKLNAKIESEIRLNPNSGKDEFSLRDLDKYYITVSL